MKLQQKQIHSEHSLRCFFSKEFHWGSFENQTLQEIIIRGAHSYPFFIDSNKELVRFKTFDICYVAKVFVVLKGFSKFVLSVLGNHHTEGVLIWRGL